VGLEMTKVSMDLESLRETIPELGTAAGWLNEG